MERRPANPRPDQAPAAPEKIAALRSIVEKMGASRAAKTVCMSQQTLLRVLAGLPVLRGTLALVDAALAKAGPSPERAPDAA